MLLGFDHPTPRPNKNHGMPLLLARRVIGDMFENVVSCCTGVGAPLMCYC